MAAVYFKNFLLRRWAQLEDRESLRDVLVPMALSATPLARKQLCAAVEELADLERWPSLLPQLVSASSRDTALASLELAHAALRQLRSESGHVEMSRQARCCAELLGPMHLELWRHACDRLVAADPDSGELLRAAAQVLHDLTRPTMPEHVAQHLEIYMQGLFLALQRLSGDVLQELCQLLAMWLSRYAEVLEAQVGRCVEAVGALLQRDGQDGVAVSAMAVLSAAACQEWHAGPFKDPAVLGAVCEHVVLPNLKLRPMDLELFHNDLQDRPTDRSGGKGLSPGVHRPGRGGQRHPDTALGRDRPPPLPAPKARQRDLCASDRLRMDTNAFVYYTCLYV